MPPRRSPTLAPLPRRPPLRRGLALLPLLLAGAGCRANVELPADACRCKEASDVRSAGAVVVRWRLQDTGVGRLFSRGQCCCAPGELDAASDAARSCGTSGQACPESPAWLVSEVRLRVRPLSPGAGVGGSGGECYISAVCSDAELTTDFCLAEGEYELQLVASLGTLSDDGAAARFAFSGRTVRSAPAVRRTVRPGQIVNLDAVLLGVNEPGPAPDLGGDL